MRSRITSPATLEETSRVANEARAVELTAYNCYSAKLPTAASRRDDAGGITVKIAAPGWAEYTDYEGSGKQYYVNEASGETSWWTLPASARSA